MTDNELGQLGELLVAASEIFDKELSPTSAAIYIDILKRYPIADVRNAFNVVLRERTFHKFPLPADFIKIIEQPIDPELRGRLAFKTCQDALRIHSSYESVTFDDAAISAVVNHFGGWVAYADLLRSMSARDFEFHERDWAKLYAAYLTRELKPTIHYGRTAIDNDTRGFISLDQIKPIRIEGLKTTLKSLGVSIATTLEITDEIEPTS